MAILFLFLSTGTEKSEPDLWFALFSQVTTAKAERFFRIAITVITTVVLDHYTP